MNKRLIAVVKRYEVYVVAGVIGVVFVAAMCVLGWFLRTSVSVTAYETLEENDLKRVFATGYLRFREDDGAPYLKVELHNGTLWWIKQVEFDFDGVHYSLKDPEAFRPLHFGAVRCSLSKRPIHAEKVEIDLRIAKAFGYPPADARREKAPDKIAEDSRSPKNKN
jgi:hypothetical protein